ncbi:cytochrome c [Sulfitobacter sp. HNIBRBA3233]|uniref:cytochrome c n=1 Tax=Sulfitobacter marinivivus TaxID=3158558 RepID=UPI0032E00CC9
MRKDAIAAIGLGMAVLGACSTEPPTSYASGRQIYENNCLQCHGDDARGGGPASLGLGVVPPSLRGLSETYGGDFPRLYVAWMIRGQDGLADPEAPMPDFSNQGFDRKKPLAGHMSPAPAQLADLLDYLEAIQD